MTGRIRKNIVLLLAAALLTGGCQSRPATAPELLEFAYSGENYRAVTTSDLGYRECGAVRVEPVEDGYFWNLDVQVKTIPVTIGQHVQEGDVLALAAIGNISDQLEEANARLLMLQQKAVLEDQIAVQAHEEMEFRMAGQYINGDTEGNKETAKALSLFEEDTVYRQKLRNQEIELLKKNISELKKLQKDGEIRAKYAGYVTYVKDMTVSATAGKDENVVTVARESESVLCTSDSWVKRDLNNRLFYVEIEGDLYELEACRYSAEEKKALDQKSIKTEVTTFVRADGGELPENGTILCLYGDKPDRREVPVVGTDSLMSDGNGTYVYVKSANDAGKEVRYIKTGRSNGKLMQTEILEGLSVGEEVYYFNNVPQIHSEGVTTAEESDNIIWDDNSTTHKRQRILEVGYSDRYGIVEKIFKHQDEYVEAGELLYTIRTDKTESELKGYRDSMAALREDENRAQAAFEKQVKELEKQIQTAKDNEAWRLQQKLDMEHAAAQAANNEVPDEQSLRAAEYGITRPNYIAYVDPYGSEQLIRILEQTKLSREIEKLTNDYYLKDAERALKKAKENNNGYGIVSIYAGATGTLCNMKISEGNKLTENQLVYVIQSDTERVVTINSDMPSAIGGRVIFTGNTTGNTYEGRIIGCKGDGKAYLNEQDGKISVSRTPQNEVPLVYYVEIEGEAEEFMNAEESFKAAHPQSKVFHGFSLPYNVMCSETVEGSDYYFVWMQTDNGLVKQYVGYTAPIKWVGDNSRFSEVPPDTVFVTGGLRAGDMIAQERRSDRFDVNLYH